MIVEQARGMFSDGCERQAQSFLFSLFLVAKTECEELNSFLSVYLTVSVFCLSTLREIDVWDVLHTRL